MSERAAMQSATHDYSQGENRGEQRSDQKAGGHQSSLHKATPRSFFPHRLTISRPKMKVGGWDPTRPSQPSGGD
jgi:hypothetical protein